MEPDVTKGDNGVFKFDRTSAAESAGAPLLLRLWTVKRDINSYLYGIDQLLPPVYYNACRLPVSAMQDTTLTSNIHCC